MTAAGQEHEGATAEGIKSDGYIGETTVRHHSCISCTDDWLWRESNSLCRCQRAPMVRATITSSSLCSIVGGGSTENRNAGGAAAEAPREATLRSALTVPIGKTSRRRCFLALSLPAPGPRGDADHGPGSAAAQLVRGVAVNHVVRVLAGQLLRGTPPWSFYLRLSGARVGRRVYVNSLSVSDYNLLEFGDDVVIGADAHIAGHTVERGVVKMAPVSLGPGVMVGVGSIVDIGATAGAGCQIGAQPCSQARNPRGRCRVCRCSSSANRWPTHAIDEYRRSSTTYLVRKRLEEDSQLGDARFVLLGEASHGTHEFYRERAAHHAAADRGEGLHGRRGRGRLARRLPRQPLRARQRRRRTTRSRRWAASGASRTWMWRNADVLDFVGWLRAHNDALPATSAQVGFYGLDLYSLHASIEAVLALPGYGRSARPRSARASATPASTTSARTRRPTATPPASALGRVVRGRGRWRSWSSCSAHAAELRRARRPAPRTSSSSPSRTRGWSKNAEEYYRTMFGGRVSSWNLRDRHMAETLDALARPPRGRAAQADTRRRLGAQLAPRRRARHRDGRARAS